MMKKNSIEQQIIPFMWSPHRQRAEQWRLFDEEIEVTLPKPALRLRIPISIRMPKKDAVNSLHG